MHGCHRQHTWRRRACHSWRYGSAGKITLRYLFKLASLQLPRTLTALGRSLAAAMSPILPRCIYHVGAVEMTISQTVHRAPKTHSKLSAADAVMKKAEASHLAWGAGELRFSMKVYESSLIM